MGIFHRQREFLETMHAAREGRLREAITDGPARAHDMPTGNVRVFQPSPAPPAAATSPADRSTAPSQIRPATKSSGTKKPKSTSRAEWNADTFDRWTATGKLPKAKKSAKPKVWNTDTFHKWTETGELPKTKKSDKSRKRAA